MRFTLRLAFCALAATTFIFANSPSSAIEINTATNSGLDAAVSEIRNTTTNEVTYGFNGTGVDMNARYNGYNGGLPAGSTEEGSDTDNDDRNEFWLIRFDLSNEASKSQIANTAIKLTAMRDSNLQKDLRIWGIKSGTTGLNTITESSLIGDLPWIVQDLDITTMSVDPSTTTYLGDFLFPNHPGDIIPVEGDLLTINQVVIDTTGPNGTSEPGGAGVSVQSTLDGYLRSLGPTDMAIFLVGGVASNGQVRVGTKEATATSTGAFSCPSFECAPIMTYDLAEGTPGDFDGDTDVDGRDFLVWQRNPSIGNLGDWQANYPVPGLAATTAVPEPSTAALLFGLASCLAGLRRSRNYV
jgi:hypothetical protein